ncbi:SRPBCC family protein [Jannaschia sp. Os4]|uniref:SRPBCC family protein n=1 Tax=Jannaschia sp. Os4 TaxID=2807617 RepID=UPI00193A1667|nr:SRPBCC family protein [Jannaschia sp. Os4]MBM2577247.1 SRPBCC family protein [Jannaschia sp. Os4]
MEVRRTVRIDAAPDRVWQILGPDYVRAGDWASSVYVSGARPGEALPGAPAAGRVCETSLGAFTETIEAYDPAARRIAYSATGAKMPGFVRSLVNEWTVAGHTGGGSEVSVRLRADLAFPFSLVMALPMKLQFRKVMREATEELRHYAETGRPHPRKAKADRSKKARAAVAAQTA